VLIVSKFNQECVGCRELFNLFSNYGAVVRIKITRAKPDTALIEFKESVGAQSAFFYLKNVRIFGSPLDVNFSKYDSVHPGPPGDLPAPSASAAPHDPITLPARLPPSGADPHSMPLGHPAPSASSAPSSHTSTSPTPSSSSTSSLSSSIGYVDDDVHCKTVDYESGPLARFARPSYVLAKNLSHPNTVLHASNLSPSTTLDSIVAHLSVRAPPIGHTLCPQGDRPMALLQYATIELATETLCLMHNTELDGQLLRLAFSKSRVL
jgi:RNA recognition motif-containing protein